MEAEMEYLVQLRQHPDPLVRMNLAALLGKVEVPQTYSPRAP
jgi:hypothetical protein